MDNHNKLYFLSGLSFFPLFGILISIPLLIISIIKKHDKPIIRILIISILINSIISIYPYYMINSLFGDNDSVEETLSTMAPEGLYLEMSQNELTYILEEIELYKIENNRYPKSLYELKNSKEEGILIFDSLQQGWLSEKESALYYYKLLDANTYHLFSKGQDNSPFTKDDIYPIVSKNLRQVGFKKPETNKP